MRIVFLLIVSLLTSACSSGLSVITQEKPRQKLDLPDPEPIVVLPVEFIVITKDNASSVFSKMERGGKVPVLFGLTGISYKNLALNMQDIQRFIRIQTETLRLYREYYEESE